MPPDPRPDPLSAYRAKRSPGRTPEPFEGGAARGRNIFVVQKHHARNLHWDFRLEMGGVLVSWAVPKGPSPDPADKRLAMHVEDHPLEYSDFEGVIPEGEYGAGPVIVWDRGTWVPKEDPEEGMEKGKLLFELRGHKLRGTWTLVHTPRAGERHWLLIKERDGHVDEGGTGALPDDSIYSGLGVDELPEMDRVRERLRQDLQARGAKQGDVDPAAVKVMLATARDEPFSREGWVFEIKYDGYRLLAARRGEEASLISRNGNDLTATFPEIARAVRGLPYDGLIVDGEVVVHDEKGLPSFGHLQKRGRLQRWSDIARASLELPATFYAFDLLAAEGHDLRALPLTERKEVLRALLPTVGPVRYSEHIAERGEAMFERVQEMGLEGVVAKKAGGPYRSGRTRDWYKIRTVHTDDFVVVGWTEPKGAREGFGAIHLGQHDGEGRLTYMGAVGTGFSEAQLGEIHEELVRREVEGGPEAIGLAGEPPDHRASRHHWVRPELVAEVRFTELTLDGLLRHPAFLRMRPEKEPAECRRVEGWRDEALPHPPAVGPAPDVRAADAGADVQLTNLEKVFFPEEELTKGDFIEYYRAVSEWLLPYLRDRPLVLTRYPDGIHGKSFFQKNAPEWAPDWLRTVTVWSEGSERDLDYFVVDDVASLLYVANSGSIPLHVWASRVSDLARPDWCVLDLDPKDAPFGDVVTVAKALRALCEGIGLPAYPKTTGSTGLHVLIPLGRRIGHDEAKMLGELLARAVVRELPEVATVARQIGRREGKVYVDYLQNGRGKLVVAPFSVRPVPEAAVSMPLRWKEVTASLDPRKYTIRNAPARMRALKHGDPMRPVLEEKPDLVGALEGLRERMGG